MVLDCGEKGWIGGDLTDSVLLFDEALDILDAAISSAVIYSERMPALVDGRCCCGAAERLSGLGPAELADWRSDP